MKKVSHGVGAVRHKSEEKKCACIRRKKLAEVICR